MNKNFIKNFIPIAEQNVPSKLIRLIFGDFIPIFLLHRFEHQDYGIHGISENDLRVSLEHFRKRGYSAISMAELSRLISSGGRLPNKSAVFTIDDGFIDQYEVAAPLFAEFDIPLTIFLITDFINNLLWPWDDQLSYIFDNSPLGSVHLELPLMERNYSLENPENRYAALNELRNTLKESDNTDLYPTIDNLYSLFEVEKPEKTPKAYRALNWDNARKLEQSGHSVAAHTLTHRILSKLSADDSKREIQLSINEVNSRLGRKIDVFAYPTGRESDYGVREINYLDSIGIKASVSSTAKPFSYRTPALAREKHSIPRFAMPENKSDFIQYLSWIEFVKDTFRK